ncbi:extracellular solute-binding protein [Halobacillus litoralis]|uniref:Extracellular solute-binding protein n=1 Tax=Halobacillus litoralis TaxID=45668 RepID=A0A845DXI5_9BACI|nr:sugar ABC transporter substrate-binding protein [Halobacillus litoralis]MYL21529.1 extracellular solute-binding protein [Halobacillus litoralis]
MKRFGYVVFGLILLFMAACSSDSTANSEGDGGAGSGENASSDTVETGSVETTVEASGDEDVVLDFWIHQTGEDETKAYIDLIDGFNEAHEDIHVNAEVIIDDGASAYSDSINAALVAGNLPDVMAVDGPYVASFADAGVIQPIDDYIDEETKNQYVDSIIQQGTYDDQLYSLGAMEASVMLYYNKDLLEEAGIEPAESLEEAWTWDELMDHAKTLTNDDQYGLNLFMNYGVGEWLTFMGAPLAWSNGGGLISEDGTEVDGYLNSPETLESLQYVKSLFEEGVVTESPGEMQFEEGKAALALGGPWIAVSAEDAGLNWGMMPYPYKDERVSPSGSMAYAVTNNTEHPEQAAELMKWMTNEEAAIKISEATGMPPAQKSAFENMDKFNERPWSVMKEQVIETAHARPSTPAYPVLTVAFAQSFHAAALGEDVESVVEQQVQRVKRELKRFEE